MAALEDEFPSGAAEMGRPECGVRLVGIVFRMQVVKDPLLLARSIVQAMQAQPALRERMGS